MVPVLRSIASIGAGLLLASGSAWAGSVAGTVKFEGTAPAMKPVSVAADAGCAAMHADKPLMNEILVLGEGQTMANVIVSITKGVPEMDYPAPEAPFALTQEGCQYAPHVFVVRPGQKLNIKNPDGFLHNVHAEPVVNSAVNRAMPGDLTEIDLEFPEVEPQPFEFKCDIHPWMKAWCAVLDHPFYAVTQTDGKYVIEGLEPGEYEVTSWHERLGVKTATVTVAEGAAAQADFSYSR